MNNILEEKINYEIDWRTKEISIIKTMPYTGIKDNERRKVLLKYSIVSMYSLWEGYVRKVLAYYIEEVNKLTLEMDEINVNLIMHDLDCKYQLANPRKDIDKKCDFVKALKEYFKNDPIITQNIPGFKNIDYKTLNKYLKTLGLKEFPEKPFKNDLNKLVKIRNIIAHGEENPLVIEQNMVNELSFIILCSMHELCMVVVEESCRQSYLNL